MSYSRLKHAIHVVCLFSLVTIMEVGTIRKHNFHKNDNLKIDFTTYGAFVSVFLHLAQYTVLLALPQMICHFLGLTFFNAFPGTTERNIPSDSTTDIKPVGLPHFCFRIVTRGSYPELVQCNVNKNYLTCVESGLTNFSIEVVTDKELCLSNKDTRIRQVVVPPSYRTSTGAMFKARALQYALEPFVNRLTEGDYIVHLDEETLTTRNSINGMINFALENRHDFGQGLITYTNQGIVNWLTTLADTIRVADDMGKLRFQFSAFHKPVFGWKGSYIVARYEAEKDVSYDHGPDGSIAEDCYFAMEASRKGYTFDFVMGEMWEKSPFTIMDLIRQRRRWIQGIWLVVHSGKIPIRTKLFLAFSHYAWLTLPLTTLSIFVAIVADPISRPLWLDQIGSFTFALTLYIYVFGVIKSFDLRNTGFMKLLVCIIAQVCTLIFNLIIENIACIWGIFSKKHHFYIVQKQEDGNNRLSEA